MALSAQCSLFLRIQSSFSLLQVKKLNFSKSKFAMSTPTHKPFSPFLPPLLSFIIGTATQSYFCTPLIIIIPLTITALSFLTFGDKSSTVPALLSFLFCVGGLTLSLKNYERTILQNNLPTSMIVFATVAEREKIAEKKQTRLTLNVEHIIDQNNKKTDIQFSLHYYLRNCLFEVGDQLSISNITIKKTPTQRGLKKPSFDDYLAKENILAALYHTKKSEITLLERPSASLKRWIWKKRESIYQGMMEKISHSCKPLLGLIFFGNKQQPSIENLRRSFNTWGISHHLARSGLHIVFLIAIWSLLLMFLPINMQIKRFLLLVICLLYAFLSWSSIPFKRALAAFSITQFGKMTSQRTNTLHILCIVCLIVLLINPLQLFFLDFQLTFGLTFALVLLSNS